MSSQLIRAFEPGSNRGLPSFQIQKTLAPVGVQATFFIQHTWFHQSPIASLSRLPLLGPQGRLQVYSPAETHIQHAPSDKVIFRPRKTANTP